MMEWVEVFDPVVREKTETGRVYHPDEWRDNSQFFAELILMGHAKGRSSVRFHVMNAQTKECYSMGMSAFYDAIVRWGVRNKTICGTWTFRKWGNNYGLIPVKE